MFGVIRKGLLKTIEEKNIGTSLLEVVGPFMLVNDFIILMVQAQINPSLNLFMPGGPKINLLFFDFLQLIAKKTRLAVNRVKP